MCSSRNVPSDVGVEDSSILLPTCLGEVGDSFNVCKHKEQVNESLRVSRAHEPLTSGFLHYRCLNMSKLPNLGRIFVKTCVHIWLDVVVVWGQSRPFFWTPREKKSASEAGCLPSEDAWASRDLGGYAFRNDPVMNSTAQLRFNRTLSLEPLPKELSRKFWKLQKHLKATRNILNILRNL